jgi:hypothetical protein
VLRYQGLNLGVAVGFFVHDVTPVTPNSVQVENDEASILLGLDENRITPLGAPGNGCCPAMRSEEQQGAGTDE